MTRRRRLERGRLILATHNAGKLREVAAMLAPYGLQVVSAKELGLPEPEESADTFLGNAAVKALAASRATELPALADDSGFSVAALGGDPGVRTADWATLPGGARDYMAGMRKVEERARGAADRGAWFTCALVLAWPDGHTEGFEGRATGRWVWPPRGDRGFGYDPMFVPDDGDGRTFGEMEPERKHASNHRARAFALLAEGCLPPPIPAA
jgi:XTP/dITP diphosphohydrolase